MQQLRIGGMLVGYHALCPRKAWLSANGLWMEQESDTVALGRHLDATTYAREKKGYDLDVNAPGLEHVRLVGKIDHANLSEGVLHEVKKSRAAEAAHEDQLRFYLWLLRLAGVTRSDGEPFTGQLDYPALRKTHAVTLTPEDETRLAETVALIAATLRQPHPPARLGPERRTFCAACAFEELCYG